MPLERVVEYRVALPSRYIFDLIAKVGELGIAMLMTRPPELPAPHIPSDVADMIKKAEDIVRDLSKIVTTYNIPPPEKTIELTFTDFKEMVNYVTSEGSDLLTRITQYTSTIESIKPELESLRRYLEIISRVGIPAFIEFRRVKVDFVALEPGEVADFTKAITLQKGEVMILDGEKPLAIVIYPHWLTEAIHNVYRVFNKVPIEVPREYASREAIESRIKELETKLDALTRELTDFLIKVRDRLYAVIEVGNSITNIVRQFADKAISEGEEIRTRFKELRKTIEELKSRLEELNIVKQIFEYLKGKGIKSLEFVGITYRVFAIKGELNREEVGKLLAHVENIAPDTYLVIVMNPPPDLEPDRLIIRGNVIEISKEYLKDIEASFNVIDREVKDVQSRIREVETEHKNLIKVFNEVSVYGFENLEKTSPDTASICIIVRAKDARNFENALANTLTKLAIDAEVRKFSKYAYIPEVPKERAPTLERYVKAIDVFKKIVHWYGIPKYGEITPTPITFFLFPFFYGWMFPDLGHGILIFLLGLLLAKWVYKGPNKYLRAIFDGKRFAEWGYIFMQCGIWSIVFSFIESGDVFGIPMHLIGAASAYHLVHPHVHEGGFTVAMKGVLATLGWSIIAGIVLLALSLLFKIINDFRFGAIRDAVYFGIPFLIGFISAAFAFVCAGMVPLKILADHVIEIAHEEGIPLLPSDYALKAIADWITGVAQVVPLGPLTKAGLWVLLAFIMFAWILACGFYTWKRHLHLEEPVSVYGVEGAEVYFVWSLANVISFMRLGIVAIVHAVLTALVVWGTLKLLLGGFMGALGVLVALIPGGFIGFMIFRGVFGKKFGIGFLIFCIIGAITAFIPGAQGVSLFIAAMLGNICVVIFEGLVAFIQSLRLHFYEMFTKFFRAGGTLFTPFQVGTPLIRIRIV